MSGHPGFPDVICLLAALPLVAGLVPPNPHYGMHTRRRHGDESHWYRINRIGGILLILASATGLAGLHAYPELAFPWDIAVSIVPLFVALAVTLLLDYLIWRAGPADG
ncbi:SdpI family protein [Chitinimonas sp.]|uniref:SdpI family protein n=1 Tax=Chitinimonas sp. TaxID=1934313 RepID=UPI0035AE60A2